MTPSLCPLHPSTHPTPHPGAHGLGNHARVPSIFEPVLVAGVWDTRAGPVHASQTPEDVHPSPPFA